MFKLILSALEFIKNRTHLFACLLIVVIGFMIYSNSFYGDFQFDDGVHIVKENNFNDLSIYSDFSTWTHVNNRPLAYFTLALNKSISGTDVLGYHVFNLVIHLISSLVIYFFVLLIVSQSVVQSKILKGKERLFALFVALIFLCHPIQTQAVTYLIQRMTSLAALFYILSIFFYLKARLTQVNHESKFVFIFFYFLMMVTAIASILSKQIAVTLPLAYLLVEFFFVRNNKGKRFNNYLLIGLSVVSISLFVVIIGGYLPKETENIGRFQYLVTQLRVIVKYVQLVVLPLSQNLDYNFVLSNSIWGLDELFSLLVIISLVSLIFILYKKHPLISFGIAWFFITLLVESSIIPIRDVIVEHRLYLPMFGFSIILGMLLFSLSKKLKERYFFWLLLIPLLIYGGLTLKRNTVWKTKLSLWEDVVRKSPGKARPHLNLGIAYLHLFKPIPAINQFTIANKIEPENAQIYYNRAEAYLVINRTEEAIKDLDISIQLNNSFAEAHDTRGKAKLRLRKFDEAILDFSNAIKLNPSLESAWFNRASAYLFLGEFQKALVDLDKAIEINPRFAVAYNNRGQLMLNLENYEHALSDLNKSIEIEPRLSNAYNNRAKVFYALNQIDQAISDLSTSLNYNPADGTALKLRGICYLEQNNVRLAYADLMKARDLGEQIDKKIIERCKQILNIQD